MIEAVLFDWNNTLVQFTWDDELLAAGHRAALAAIGSDAEPTKFTERYRAMLNDPTSREREYPDLLRGLLGPLGEDDIDRFIDAEHDVWLPAHEPLAAAQALLESLRTRGLKTALVANAWPDPPRLLRGDVQRLGFADLLDLQVWSPEVGVRKPDPAIFLHALGQLDVDPAQALFVGDRLDADVQGASQVGMATVQALWFRADETPGIEPDFMAFTPMDVLNAVRRLAG